MLENVKTFPAVDRQFAAEADRVLGEFGEVFAPEWAEAALSSLRRAYPNATFRWRDDLAGYSGRVCYVFRDGRVRPDDARRERLYNALARSRELRGESGKVVAEALRTASELLGE